MRPIWSWEPLWKKGNKWDNDLKEVHGLSKEEVAMVVGIVLKYLNKDKFPDFWFRLLHHWFKFLHTVLWQSLGGMQWRRIKNYLIYI